MAPQVLVMPFPAQGHILPLLHISKAIAARGFTVAFANIQSVHENAKNVSYKGIRFESIPCTLLNAPNGLDAYWLNNLGEFFDILHTLVPSVVELVHKLNTQDSPVVAILSDYFLDWTQDVADQCRIPRIIFSCFSATGLAIELALPEMISRGQVPTRGCDDNNMIIDWIQGVPPLRPSEIPIYLHQEFQSGFRFVFERTRDWPQRKKEAEAPWVLVNTFNELEPGTLEALQVSYKCVPVGPALLYSEDDACDKADECIMWLDTCETRTVVYVCFGTVAIIPPVQFKELAEALLGRVPFLWVVKKEQEAACLHEDAAWYQKFMMEINKGSGHILQWAPQRKVLVHPSVAVFITHCGWNSLLESICSSVPVLAWPVNSDQNLNCKLAVERGIGLAASTDAIWEADGIWKALEEVMHNHEMRLRVQELQLAALRAVTVGNSVDSLQKLLTQLAWVNPRDN